MRHHRLTPLEEQCESLTNPRNSFALELESEGDDDVVKLSKDDIEMGLLMGPKPNLLDEVKFSFIDESARESARSRNSDVRVVPTAAKKSAINNSESSNSQQNGQLKKPGSDPKA